MKPPERPRTNQPAPSLNKRVVEGLKNIGSIDGQPFLRLVWGQSTDSVYVYAGEEHLRYRDHVHREQVWVAVGIDGTPGKIYRAFDVIPTGVNLAQRWLELDIGIDRFFVEYAQPHDPELWNSEALTDEQGQVHIGPDGEPLRFLAECPPAGIDYDFLWVCAEHKGCCQENSYRLTGIGLRSDGTRCYGYYRQPNMHDVEEAKRRWMLIYMTHPESYGFRDPVPEDILRRDHAEGLAAAEAQYEKDMMKLEGDIYQFMKPHIKRLTSEGSGKDLEKYHILDSTKIKPDSEFTKENQ
jgi:hypothetical protein